MKRVLFSASICMLLAGTVFFSVTNAAQSGLPKEKNREAACTVLRAQICAVSQANTCSITPADCGFMRQDPLAEAGQSGTHATFFIIVFAELVGIALLFAYSLHHAAKRQHLTAPQILFSFSEIMRPLLANGLSSFRF